MPVFDRQPGASCQTHEMDGLGQQGGFIKIVDAPDEAAFGVAPGSEVLDVKLREREDWFDKS
jgi:hypothetical protein